MGHSLIGSRFKPRARGNPIPAYAGMSGKKVRRCLRQPPFWVPDQVRDTRQCLSNRPLPNNGPRALDLIQGP